MCRSLLSPLLLSVLLHAALLAGAPPVALLAGASHPALARRSIDARLVVRPLPAGGATALQDADSLVAFSSGQQASPQPIPAAPAAPVAALAGERRALRAVPQRAETPPPVQRVPAASMHRKAPVVAGEVASDLAADSETPAAPTVNAGDLRQYRWALAIAARRWQKYPALASASGWQGTATVALDFGAQRSLPRVVLLRSSGNALLDAQALEMIGRAAAATALPETLRANDLRVVMPVQFSLEPEP